MPFVIPAWVEVSAPHSVSVDIGRQGGGGPSSLQNGVGSSDTPLGLCWYQGAECLVTPYMAFTDIMVW